MKHLYAPWRHSYVTTKKPKTHGPDECVFCENINNKLDDEGLIVKRFTHCTLMLNLYPYNAGHLLLLPNSHNAELIELKPEVRAELMEATSQSLEVLKKVMKSDGANVGLNVGIAGGGGIPSHLHYHIIPRWTGDTNFLATTGDTKTICTSFEEILDTLRMGFE